MRVCLIARKSSSLLSKGRGIAGSWDEEAGELKDFTLDHIFNIERMGKDADAELFLCHIHHDSLVHQQFKMKDRVAVAVLYGSLFDARRA